MCCRQEELPPVRNAFRLPYLVVNSSSFLSKLGKNLNTSIFMNYCSLAYLTPASSWCFDGIVSHDKFDWNPVCEDQSKVLCLVLLRMDHMGSIYSVTFSEPISLHSC